VRRFVARLDPRAHTFECSPRAARVGEDEILWRGYLTNRTAIEAEARRRGERLDSGSTDSELFAAAARYWKHELVRYVEGQYAVAIRSGDTLVLAHDELGIFPLFYAETAGGVVAGSHLEDLVAETGIGTLDERFIADFLLEQRHFGAHTPYAHIRQLRAGEAASYQAGQLATHRVWTIAQIRPLVAKDPRDYEDGLRAAISSAVHSAVPPGRATWCELSGGLDSSTVFAEAARCADRRVEAFSMLYPGSEAADEQRWIRPVLERYPAPWHTMDANASKPFAVLPQRFCPQPRIGLVTEGWRRDYDAMLEAHGVDVVVTGQGGDALFIGDSPRPFVLADLARRGDARGVWKGLRAWSAASRQKRSPIYFFREYVIRALERHARGRFINYEPEDFSWINRGFVASSGALERTTRSYVPRVASVADSVFFELILRCAEVTCNHNAERDGGAEFRHPLLDRALVAFVVSVPWSEKLHPECDRLLQRRAYETILPRDTVLRRSKARPDGMFYSGLLSSPKTYRLLADDPQIVARGYVDGDAWRKAVHLASLGKSDGIRWFLATAALEIWLSRLAAYAPSPIALEPA
jgi:asparagine synthase (glutamine-hydrolysing)